MSSDRSGAGDGDDEVRRSEGRQRARPVSLVRSMSVNVDSGLAGEIFDHFCNAATLKSILRSFRFGSKENVSLMIIFASFQVSV